MLRHSTLYLALFVCFVSIAACSRLGGAGASGSPKLETEDQKTLYALGLLLGRNVKTFSLTPQELLFVKAGFSDAATDAKAQVDLATYGPKVDALAQARTSAGTGDMKKKGQAFADGVAKQTGAIQTPSGIVIRTIKAGSGPSPEATDIVKVNYEGKLIDGTVFDSSIDRGQPAEFPLDQVVPCWGEALQKMKKGEKSQVVCPSTVAYGERGAPPVIPPGATLSFEVELLDFHKK